MPRWREKRDQVKHDHVLDFAVALPELRETVTRDLAGRGLSRERVLAAAVRLLDLGFFRVGGERYAEDNGTYGLATLHRKHVSMSRGEIVFCYPAKGGYERVQAIAEPQVPGHPRPEGARIGRRCPPGLLLPRPLAPGAQPGHQ
jgi:DNA topoisomerase IB